MVTGSVGVAQIVHWEDIEYFEVCRSYTLTVRSYAGETFLSMPKERAKEGCNDVDAVEEEDGQVNVSEGCELRTAVVVGFGTLNSIHDFLKRSA